MSESLRLGMRYGCCAEWRKPCPYHEGWDDGHESIEAERDALEAGMDAALAEAQRYNELQFQASVERDALREYGKRETHEADALRAEVERLQNELSKAQEEHMLACEYGVGCVHDRL